MSLTFADDRPVLRHLANVRWALLVLALLLAGVGMATIHSASSELTVDYLPRQALWVALGLVALVVMLGIDYQSLTKFSLPLYVIGLIALAAVLFLGTVRGGAKSWFGFGSFGLQPSEFAKLTTALLLAKFLAGTNRRYLQLHQIATACGLVGAPMALIVLQHDLGSALMFLPMLAGMLFVAGVRWQVLVAAALLALVAGVVLWNFVMFDYQKGRVMTFLDPGRDPLGAGYQLRQSKIAVGSGQILGRGYMQGTQSQLRFLPARHTDFVFAVLAEEWGFLGRVGGARPLWRLRLQRRPGGDARSRSDGHPARSGPARRLCVPRPLQHRHGGRPRSHHRYPSAVSLLRRLVHLGQLHRRGHDPRGRFQALCQPLRSRH